METTETKIELGPNEPGSNRGFGSMILEKPLDPVMNEDEAEIFYDRVVELTREIFGEEKSMAFAGGVLAGTELEKNRLKRWAADESEPLPEGDHQAAEETNGGDIDKAVAEAETVPEATITTETDRGKEYIEIGVKHIEELLEGWKPEFRERIVQIVQDRLPAWRAEDEAEMALEKARDNFINYCLNNLTRSEEKELYEKLLADVKAGNELVADAA